MEILIIGGIYSREAKFNNAVFCLAKSLSKLENVIVLNISMFPFSIKKQETDFEIFRINIFILLFYSLKNILKTYKSIKPYVQIFSLYGLLVFVRYLLNVTRIEYFLLKRKKPDVINIHSTDLERSAFFRVLKNLDMPIITTIHGIYSLDPNFDNSYNVNALETEIFSNLMKSNDFIVFVSSGIKIASVNHFQIKAKNLHVINNGVDLKKFKLGMYTEDMRYKYKIPPEKKVLLQVGTLYKIKNHITVLKALSKMEGSLSNRIHYVIVGDGPECDDLKEFCIKNGLTNKCTFTGRMVGQELLDMYAISNFLIVPSTSEAFPLVYLEAISMGLPIITFKDLWPVKDFYNEDYMELIDIRSTKAIIESVKRALDKEWDREKIILHSKRYSWKNIAKKYVELFDKAINNGEFNEG